MARVVFRADQCRFFPFNSTEKARRSLVSRLTGDTGRDERAELTESGSVRRAPLQVPRRSILKPANSTGSIHELAESQLTSTFTTTFYQDEAATTASYTVSTASNPATTAGGTAPPELDTASTENATRRQSRRVSFAPTAQMRCVCLSDLCLGNQLTVPHYCPPAIAGSFRRTTGTTTPPRYRPCRLAAVTARHPRSSA